MQYTILGSTLTSLFRHSSLQFALDVVDDMLGEAQEIAEKGNAFFVYTPALHRLREGGFNNPLFDRMDERLLSARQRAGFLSTLVVGSDAPPLPPHTAANFNAEVISRAAILPSAWNPRTRQLQKIVDPTQTGGMAMSFFMKVVLVLMFALWLRSMLAPSSHGQGYSSHHRR
jgi:hypothetical protein